MVLYTLLHTIRDILQSFHIGEKQKDLTDDDVRDQNIFF